MLLSAMDTETIEQRVLYLREVEKLSIRQIAGQLRMCRKRIGRILNGGPAAVIQKPALLEPYRQLITTWYGEYPSLQAKQIYERLLPYGYSGSYRTVIEGTRHLRCKKPEVFHVLEFLPGEEAQVDWFFFQHPRLGQVAGFLYVLAYSRYAWGRFYPKTSFEFFLAAHLECFQHLKGLARRHRYDNLKSVVIRRTDHRIEYNPQFLDFARFFGFSIHACNPYAGNEKGRVERLVRDVRGFLYGRGFHDLADLNTRFWEWLIARNRKEQRSTGKTPLVLLAEEKLLRLPQGTYPPTRTIPGVLVSKTALVEFETNRYSVPSGCALKKVELVAWPEKIELIADSKTVAIHSRSFAKHQTFQNPLHSEKLLERSPQFKYKRILQLIRRMDPSFEHFLAHQENDAETIRTAYEIFKLLKICSRTILTSAVRELNGMGAYKIKALWSLLNLPSPRQEAAVWPVDTNLLKITYVPRNLKDYDPTD